MTPAQRVGWHLLLAQAAARLDSYDQGVSSELWWHLWERPAWSEFGRKSRGSRPSPLSRQEGSRLWPCLW